MLRLVSGLTIGPKSCIREIRKLQTALHENVTKNRELEKAYHNLKSAQSQLLQAEKMQSIGRLAAGVAHELNIPIQFIGDNLRFFEESFSDMQRLKNARDIIIDNAAQGQNVIENIQKSRVLEEEADWEYH